MADDKSTQKAPATHPPPPLDPFPTYGQPFPRSSSESKEDPFITFRRFADSQISLLLSSVAGLPALFAQSPSTGRFADLEDEMNKRRQQLEEGWRKQWEQEREEEKQEWEKFKKGFECWSPIPSAARIPDRENFVEDLDQMQDESNIPQGSMANLSKHRSKTCPALHELETELDLYETELKQNKEYEKCVSQKWAALDKEANASGWDGKQKAKSEQYSIRGDRPEHLLGFASHTFRSTRGFDPVSNPDQTMPWLLTSPYSPIYLSNPSQPRLFRVDMIDEPMVPFRIFRPVYKDQFTHPVAEELATKLSWADAFEDLLSLEQTGKMVDRDFSTWKTPNSWIHDMVARGSLGPRWGFDDQNHLIKKDLIHQTHAQPRFVSLWPSADSVQLAMQRAEDTQEEEVHSIPDNESDEESSSNSFWSSSTSSSWSSSFGGGEQDPNEVVSTMNTTTKRSLPDGSIKTKRVFKKRFANGREESDESVENQNGSKQHHGGAYNKNKNDAQISSKILNEVGKLHDKQTQTFEQKKEPSKKSGWFWL